MNLYLYLCTYTYMYRYMYIYVGVYVYACVWICMGVYMYVYIYVYIVDLLFSCELRRRNHESSVQFMMKLVLGSRVIGENIIGAKLRL